MIEFSTTTSVHGADSGPLWHTAGVLHAAATSLWNVGGFAVAMAELGVVDALAPRTGFAPRLVASDGRLALQPFLVEELSIEQLDAVRVEWSALAARALEPNVFYTPGFALSAARHFPTRNRPRFIVVWEMCGGARRMIGLFPIVSSGFFGDGLIRMWLHKQATRATPLVDRDAATETLNLFLDWVGARSAASGVVFLQTLDDGRFHAALRDAAAHSGRETRVLAQHFRAALFAGDAAEAVVARVGARNRLSQLRRQRRRLAEMGRVTLEEDALPQDVRRAAEEFLALESSGWKAGRGALLSQPSLATFFRSATRLMARDEECRIVSLRLDGRPLAMMVVLDSQHHSFFWKIAFDEAFRAQAPGIQLFFEQSRAQLARPGLDMTDSCAIADHPMIDRLWSDRIGVCDVAVQLQGGRQGDFLSSCRSDQRRRNVRELAKRAAHRVLNRRIV